MLTSSGILANPGIKKLIILIPAIAFISACGGGGSSDTTAPTTPTTPTTYSVIANFVKGPVTGGNCELYEVSQAGGQSTSIATGSTTSGTVDFGDDIEYQGTGLISCTGGTYTDEATGSSLTAPTMRAVVDIDGNGSFVVSPLTEIAVQRAGNDLNSALTTHNSNVADALGLSNINITNIIPTNLITTAASNNAEGQYATILALVSQLNEDDARSLATIIDDLAIDLEDGTFSIATLESLTNAEENLADSEVSSNLSDTALATVTASAGIPDPEIDNGNGGGSTDQPNILLIISDDQGVDSSAEYDFSMDPPNTPVLSALAAEGVTFENAWSSPSCAPTRAAILTGQFGVNNGILSSPGDIDEDDIIIHEFLAADEATNNYSSAYIGKWHLGAQEINNPVENGISYFAGALMGNIDDYDNWLLTEAGTDIASTQIQSTEYNTSELTDLAENWIDEQDSPWMLVLAYNAPHTPLHWPDESLHTRTGYTNDDCVNAAAGTNETKRECYLAMIEAMDSEIGNLLDSMTTEERENTIILYVGDNGTANGQRDTAVFNGGEVKGTLYEGGVRVPLVVSGPGVSREGISEDRLVTVTDIYSTIAELAGSNTNYIYDSLSFADYFSSEGGETRRYAYSDYENGWTVRNQGYQLINDENSETLFELNPDNFNTPDVTESEPEVLYELQVEAAKVRSALSGLAALAGDFSMLDITDGGDNQYFTDRVSTCARMVREQSASATNLRTNDDFTAEVEINLANGICSISSNSVPNHDFQNGVNFANAFAINNEFYSISATPELADQNTELGAGSPGVLLNGIKIDILAAACLGVGDERTMCNTNAYPNDDPDTWRFDPMFADNGFQVDTNNAHTQPGGLYHYHGNPNALFDQSGEAESGTIGFASDGFPIYGSFINDREQIRKVTSSYRLKSGNRPTIAVGGSSAQYSQQPYDGTFRQDYEYIEGSGDLDECNGMVKDGNYGYYVTDEFPYIIGCLKGTPDNSF